MDMHASIVAVAAAAATAPPSSAASAGMQLLSADDVIYAYMTNVGDGIIISRVFAIWGNGPTIFVVIVLLAPLGGSLLSSALLTYCAARLGPDIMLGAYQNPPFCRNMQTVSYSATLLTTASATSLILYKTWSYRRIHIDVFGGAWSRTPVQNFLLLLVESGVLYMLFFAVQVIVSLDAVNTRINQNAVLALAFTVYEYNSSIIVGIYPTIVVILARTHTSKPDVQPRLTLLVERGVARVTSRSPMTSSPLTGVLHLRPMSARVAESTEVLV
ncbi:hypothetical protein PsYK624_164460 [Phanerochaete sordida]|uniref:Uncharacterized protein n=1 Tax=Phanerochaete sordida TaxID=48140 RepID=A0A9P3LM38_9APHY|nr:hypothetical protein PsYK624_164460 [Phanerochaete sordida]